MSEANPSARALRLIWWSHHANVVEIKHTRSLTPGDEQRLHAAIQAYVASLHNSEASTDD